MTVDTNMNPPTTAGSNDETAESSKKREREEDDDGTAETKPAKKIHVKDGGES